MKTTPALLLAGLLVGSGATTLRSASGPSVKTVVSIEPENETPASARIAPTSSIAKEVAQAAASRLSPLIKGTQVFTVSVTGSMRPAFDDNTVLLTEPAPFGSLQVGDIVVFTRGDTNERVAHRILERRDEGFWTKGDRASRMDEELVTEKNYVGRVYGILYTSRSPQGPLPDALRDDDMPTTVTADANATMQTP